MKQKNLLQKIHNSIENNENMTEEAVLLFTLDKNPLRCVLCIYKREE